MDFRKILTLLRERGMDAELGTLNNGLPQISVRISGITFFAVPDHFPGYQKAESDFICLRTYLRMDTVDVHRKEQSPATSDWSKYTASRMKVRFTPFLKYRR